VEDKHKKLLGKRGEEIARDFLVNKGYELIKMNHRTRLGEVDLILIDGGVVVFVEVKTRRFRNQGLPEEAVTERKLKTIGKVAESFLMERDWTNRQARIDVVAVEMTGDLPIIRHIENAS